MGNKVRVKARSSRGSGSDEAMTGLKQILIENYADTVAEYDKLSDADKNECNEILGSLAS